MGNNLSGRSLRKRLVVFLFALLSTPLFTYELEVLPEKPRVGRVLTLKILTDIENTEEVKVIKDMEFPESFGRISGPIVNTYRKRVDGRYKRFYQVTWALRVNKSGIYDLPEFEVDFNGKVETLKFPTVKVFLRDEVNNNYPTIVQWNPSIKREIFVGESLPVIIEAINLEDIQFHDYLYSRKPRNGSFEEVQGLGSIDQLTVDESDIYNVSIQSWIFTPLQTGNVTIPSVRVDINGLTRYTGDLKIKVLPLPEQNETGGVGEFLVSTSLDKTQITPADEFQFKVKLSGMGNLEHFKIPDISYEGLIVLDKKEDKQYDYSDKGYVGWREITYTLQALEPGVKEISIPPLSWIDWQGKTVFYNGSISNVNIVTAKIVHEEIRPYLSLFTAPEIISSYRVYLYKQPLLWLTLLISPLVLLVLSIFKKIKISKDRKIVLISVTFTSLFLMSMVYAKGIEFQSFLAEAENLIEEEDYKSAITIYDNLIKELPLNYGLYINNSILWDKLGNRSRAVYSIRMAERVFPGSERVTSIKRYLSDSDEHYEKQAKTVVLVNPDILFIILIILVNLLLLILIRSRKNPSITTLSLVIFINIFIISLIIGVVYIDRRNSTPAGVISTGGASIRKVPNSMALDWMDLPEGNTVYIRGEWEDQYLIETEYGLQGWLDKGSLLVLEEL